MHIVHTSFHYFDLSLHFPKICNFRTQVPCLPPSLHSSYTPSFLTSKGSECESTDRTNDASDIGNATVRRETLPANSMMDAHLRAWILEFFLTQPEAECLTETLLQALPLPEYNTHLQKLVLLCSIREQVTDSTISETTLEILEVIEKIDRDQGVAITESMKKAYCSTMLDCTMQSCDKLWRTKGAWMEKSILRQLVFENFGMRVEVAGPVVWDPAKSRNYALKALTQYLAEAFGTAPSLLETVGNDERWVKELEFAEDGPIQEEQAPLMFCVTQNTVNSKDLHSSANEPISSTEDQVGKDPIITNGDSGNMNVPARLTDTAKGHELSESPKAQETCIHELKDHKRPSHVIETKDTEPCCSRNYSRPSSEVHEAKKALTMRIQELKTVVADSLPEAMRVSGALASGLEMKDATHISELEKGIAAELLATDNEASQCEGQDQVNQHPLNRKHIVECVNANGENSQTLEGDPGKKPCSKLRVLHRRSLMERNVTASTSEREGTISSCTKGSPGRIQPRTPKGIQISPLRKGNRKEEKEEKDFGRRKRKMWSVEEEDALRKAVWTYGDGNWELILRSNPGVFGDRRGGDLKDKWRNMMK